MFVFKSYFFLSSMPSTTMFSMYPCANQSVCVQVDVEGDGKVDFYEFLSMMTMVHETEEVGFSSYVLTVCFAHA